MEKGVKSRAHQDLTAAHHGLQKPASLAGISRTYQPKDEEGEQLPPESTLVQVRAEDVLRDTARALTRLFDVTATEDWANCDARADITVDGRVLVEATDKHPAQVEVSCEDVPVGYWTTVKFSDALPAQRVKRAPGAGGEAPAGGEVRPRGGERRRGHRPAGRRRRFGYLFG